MLTFTNYRISTMTATGCIGVNVNLDSLYDHVIIVDILDTNVMGIVYAEFGSNKHSQICKGVNLKKRYVRVNGKKEAYTKRFDNSVTIKYRVNEKDTLNIKVFKNGKIQMTGVKSVEQGKNAIQSIIDMIKNIHENHDKEVVDNIDDLKFTRFDIHLINSDFRVDMEIRRDLLYNLLLKEFSVSSSYEACIYPGVKIQYNLNKNLDINTTPLGKQGKCCCPTPCNGKGDGITTDACKKITISIFQSGCILITGVTKEIHIDIAYNFIKNVLNENHDKIKRVKLQLPS
jgi:TATA-box binding protein (TBP) (component of TFIID and TFIIIB)|uniref:TATA-box binding protein n=1 Tax=viral metagenome TaxID=1070528 RepID=A0A6C0BRK8_9ZZZZ